MTMTNITHETKPKQTTTKTKNVTHETAICLILFTQCNKHNQMTVTNITGWTGSSTSEWIKNKTKHTKAKLQQLKDFHHLRFCLLPENNSPCLKQKTGIQAI